VGADASAADAPRPRPRAAVRALEDAAIKRPTDDGDEPESPPPEKTSLRIARAIAREVAEKRLPPGSMLATEQEMAREYNAGRPSVREALRLLEAQGLIVLRRGIKGGPVVAAPTGIDLGQTMTMFLQMRSTPFRQVVEAITELSGLVAEMAAERVARGEGSVAELRAALEVENQHLYEEYRLSAGIEFHNALHRLAGNEVIQLLVEAVGGIWADRTRLFHSDVWDEDEQLRMYTEHVKMLKAIERGDGRRAARLAKDHMAVQAQQDLERHPEVAQAIVDWR
jgi:DNA-binding FadR family transcriptional regulator